MSSLAGDERAVQQRCFVVALPQPGHSCAREAAFLSVAVVLFLLCVALRVVPAPGQEAANEGNSASTNDAAGADAKTEAEMKPYREVIANTDVAFDMVPIPGGTFTMGSPAGEPDRQENEGPQHQVRVDPFWMGRCEVTWDEYDIFTFNLDAKRREFNKTAPSDRHQQADQTVYRHDVRHGPRRVSRHLHDATRRKNVLRVAQR